jgi:predicted RNA binding protein YcfA (HicA-like mRNA interferase family)
MTEHEKLLRKIVSTDSDADIWFHGMCSVLRRLGFQERMKGNHHIFTRDQVQEILILQSKAIDKAKPYQVRQVREIILNYRLGGSEESGQ